jgi:hypothetical protein
LVHLAAWGRSRKDRQLVQMDVSSLGTTKCSVSAVESRKRCLVVIIADVLAKLIHNSVGVVQEVTDGSETERAM